MAKHSPPAAGPESSANKPLPTETTVESTSDVKVNGNHLTTSSDPAAGEASATSVEAVKDLLIDQLATSSSSLS